MLYFSEYVLNIVSKGNLFNSFLTTGILATILVSPISEELIFRGVFLNRLKLIVPTTFAVLISSLLFASLHGFGSIFAAFIFGICVALLYLKTENILVPIAAHFLNNLFAEIILVCDSNKILFTNASVISVMSILAVVSFAILLVYIIRQLKVLNNDKL
jgi:membrane protease YdiL (CAAX protease family)